MFREIILQNFQSHTNTKLTFVPGVNVITGKSDSGKSGIIRALRWALLNRPSGFAFRSYDAEGEPTYVSIELDSEDTIIRIKGKGINEYRINKTVYSALRSEVPQEISDLFNMEPCNLQTQFDPYFLLQDSAGQVMRKLHEVGNLEIIDVLQSRLFAEIRKSKSRIDMLKAEHVDITTQLSSYEKLDQIQITLHTLEQLDEQRQSFQSSIQILQKVIAQYKTCREKIADVVDWLEIIPAYEKINEVMGRFKEIKLYQTKLEQLCASIRASKRRFTDTELRLNQLRRSEKDILEKYGVCPICNTPKELWKSI